jgi:hypothetical protein
MYPEIENKLTKMMEGYQVSHMSVLWLISGVVNTVSISIVCFITSIFNYH